MSVVFRWNTNGFDLPLDLGPQWFNGSGIVDCNEGFITRDWGVSIRNDGTLAFGGGTPDVTVTNNVSVILTNAIGQVTDTRFHVLVAQMGNGRYRLYVDDHPPVEISGVDTGPRVTNTFLTIGAIGNGAGSGALDPNFRGDIADIRFYGDAVSGASVNALLQSLSDDYALGLSLPQPAQPEITAASAAAGTFTLTFTSEPEVCYTIWKRATVAGTESSIGTVTANGASTSFTDVNATGDESYYRVSVP
jgi:hypothetical protein